MSGIVFLGIDLAKNVFILCGAKAGGRAYGRTHAAEKTRLFCSSHLALPACLWFRVCRSESYTSPCTCRELDFLVLFTVEWQSLSHSHHSALHLCRRRFFDFDRPSEPESVMW
jgi:hypothetical protein